MTKRGFVVALISVAAGCSSGPSGFAGVYTATFSGTYTNTTPNNVSGTFTDEATITVTDQPSGRIEVRWQGGSSQPDGAIVFRLTGSAGTAVQGTGGGGNCITGTQSGGNTQTICCEQCSITFSGKTFTQQQAGSYSGTTPQNTAYTGVYSGTWTGTSSN